MTRASLLSEAPFGEALRQAGPRATAWLDEVGGTPLIGLLGEIGPPSTTFENATKSTPARVEVRLRDGRTATRELTLPVGAIGPDLRARHAELVRAKFLSTGGDPRAADIGADLAAASAADVRTMLELALPG